MPKAKIPSQSRRITNERILENPEGFLEIFATPQPHQDLEGPKNRL